MRCSSRLGAGALALGALLLGCGQPTGAAGSPAAAPADQAADGTAVAPVDGILAASADPNHRLEIEGRRVGVTRPEEDVDVSAPGEVTILARRPARLLILETLPSRAQSLGRCGAGEEKWVELIDLEHDRSLYSRRVESCLQGIVPGDPVAEWPEGSPCIAVNLVSESSQRISQDGRECPE